MIEVNAFEIFFVTGIRPGIVQDLFPILNVAELIESTWQIKNIFRYR